VNPFELKEFSRLGAPLGHFTMSQKCRKTVLFKHFPPPKTTPVLSATVCVKLAFFSEGALLLAYILAVRTPPNPKHINLPLVSPQETENPRAAFSVVAAVLFYRALQ